MLLSIGKTLPIFMENGTVLIPMHLFTILVRGDKLCSGQGFAGSAGRVSNPIVLFSLDDTTPLGQYKD